MSAIRRRDENAHSLARQRASIKPAAGKPLRNENALPQTSSAKGGKATAQKGVASTAEEPKKAKALTARPALSSLPSATPQQPSTRPPLGTKSSAPSFSLHTTKTSKPTPSRKPLQSSTSTSRNTLTTPRPVARAAPPKSTKKTTLNIYTPARPARREDHGDVEYMPPKMAERPPDIPTPMRMGYRDVRDEAYMRESPARQVDEPPLILDGDLEPTRSDRALPPSPVRYTRHDTAFDLDLDCAPVNDDDFQLVL